MKTRLKMKDHGFFMPIDHFYTSVPTSDKSSLGFKSAHFVSRDAGL
jgi:hypothetical protein